MRSSSILVLSVLHMVMLVASTSVPPSPPPSPSPNPAPSNVTDLPKRIDTHCHYVPPFYKTLLDSRNITSGGRPIPSWNATGHLAVNAEFGIVTSIVAISTPGVKLSQDAPIEEGRTLARQVNEYGYNLTQEYPGRFLFWATLTLPDLEGAVAEAIYALDTLGAAGVVIEASVYGELMGTPRYAPLYEVLNERKAVVFIHPSNSPCPEEEITTANSTDIPPYVVDFLLDTTRAALNLVFRNVTLDYPHITFILSHSGGFLPFAATRAAGGLALLANDPSSLEVYYELLSLYNVDLALSAAPTALPSTLAYFSTRKITYGSDYPYSPVVGIQMNTAGLTAYPLSSSNRKRIDYKNAYKLFKKFLD